MVAEFKSKSNLHQRSKPKNSKAQGRGAGCKAPPKTVADMEDGENDSQIKQRQLYLHDQKFEATKTTHIFIVQINTKTSTAPNPNDQTKSNQTNKYQANNPKRNLIAHSKV